jgi:hypothetical protein
MEEEAGKKEERGTEAGGIGREGRKKEEAEKESGNVGKKKVRTYLQSERISG